VQVRELPRDRLVGLSTRLLTGASVLVTVGLVLILRSAWQQYAQSLGPDGAPADGATSLALRATLLVLDSGYRPLGPQLLLASGLVGAAVVALHLHPSWEQVRRLRWEVLAAALLVLVVVVGLILGNGYVLTNPALPGGDVATFTGQELPTELIAGNVATLCAALLVLTVAMLWWWRLAPAPVVDPEEPDEEEPADETTTDWSREWSPEDFRPPS
jgi:hypothetical protein